MGEDERYPLGIVGGQHREAEGDYYESGLYDLDREEARAEEEHAYAEYQHEIEESTECIYCNADPVTDDVPDVDDEQGWMRLAREHGSDCEWVQTRAFMLADQIESEE